MKLHKRQGDVLVFRIDEIKHELQEKKQVMLAEGEVSGHKHLLVADRPETKLRIAHDGTGFYLEVLGGPAVIKHEEHLPITLEPGKFYIRIQQEYDPILYKRNVQD